MQNLQVTIGTGTNTPIYTPPTGRHGPPIYAQSITFQNNNASGNIRFGDSTTSTTKGIQLVPGQAITITCPLEYASQLTDWYVAGAGAALVDILVV